MTPHQAASQWADRLSQAAVTGWFVPAETLEKLMGRCDGQPDAVLDARAQKAALLHMKDLLSTSPYLNRSFPQKTGLGWLDKLLALARVKELAGVKIVKAGKSSGLRYDISELQATFYGRRILDGLSLGARRTSVTRAEFVQIRQACERVKLVLPEVVEPTTTERFFAPAEPEADDSP